MRIKGFRYKKKDGSEDEYNLAILNEGAEYLVGIDMNKLNEWEQKAFTAMMEKFDEDLKPYMKAYRKFIIENITNEATIG